MGWDEQQAWGDERGLSSREANWCLRLLLPYKSCIRYTLGDKARAAGKRCICEAPAVQELKDHYRVWHSARTGYVLTTDPYNATEERIEALREVAKSIGAVVHIDPKSVWADGVPHLIIAMAEVTPETLGL